MLRKIFLFLLIALLLIQFIHPAKNMAIGAQPAYIGNNFPVPANVKMILEKACNDCHSNNTVYPWYSKMQPVDWWLDGHIKDGKRALNLDEYTQRSLRYQYHKLEDITEQIEKGEMPLDSYTWVHKDAILTNTEKTTLLDWAKALRDTMKARYPADSLVRKKK